MAAITRATSTEPFPPLINSPRTPSSFAKAVATSQAAGGDIASPKLNHPALSPRTLTGVAASAENRKRQQQREADAAGRETSPNPAVQAMQALMGGGGVSRPSDAPDPSKVSEPLQSAAEKMRIIVDGTHDNALQVSPVSMSSFGTLESGQGTSTALTATTTDVPTTGHQFVAEPAQIADGPSYHNGNGHLSVEHDQEGPKAFSYPGPPPREQVQEGRPPRGMSLPGYGQTSPKSPASNKRHKCPYCATDFTRHHNLKSHLLTHSQEKPYVCETCQARFRRLHDLKRHTKLHTGERPHTCDKCGRRFARGDALARHNKGPGGCAGRRSSFGGDDDFGDGEGMDGVEYEDEDSSPGQERRVSEPSRKRTHLETPEDPRRQVYRQHSSTYPPPYQQSGRPHADSAGSMGPPQIVPAQNTTSSPRPMNAPIANSSYYPNSGQVLPHTGMIASPTPLSPSQAPDQQRLSVGDASMSGMRNRSPSLSTQFQQFGRGTDGRTPPAPPSQYPSSHQAPPGAPVLPLPNQSQGGRAGMPSSNMSTNSGSSMLQHHQIAPSSTTAQQGSNPGSLSSHGRSSGSSIRDIIGGGTGNDQSELWSYVRKLDQKFSRMQDEYELRISRLQEEVISLRDQLAAATSTGYGGEGMGQARY